VAADDTLSTKNTFFSPPYGAAA